MIDRYRVKIENNSNTGDIIVNVHNYNSFIDYTIYKELSALNQKQKRTVLKFIKKCLKSK